MCCAKSRVRYICYTSDVYDNLQSASPSSSEQIENRGLNKRQGIELRKHFTHLFLRPFKYYSLTHSLTASAAPAHPPACQLTFPLFHQQATTTLSIHLHSNCTLTFFSFTLPSAHKHIHKIICPLYIHTLLQKETENERPNPKKLSFHTTSVTLHSVPRQSIAFSRAISPQRVL